jgi:membrane protease YdiL (CAAX protease family)
MLSEKPWKPDALIRLLLSIGICVCSIGFLTGMVRLLGGKALLNETSPFYLVLVTSGLDGSILAMIALFIHRERIWWSEAFGFRMIGLGRAFLLAVLVVVLFLPVGWFLQTASMKALSLFRIATPEQEAVQTIRSVGPGFSRIYLLLFTVLVAPPAEEMLFRGIIYPTIKQSGFPRLALWGTSFLFAAIHLSAPIFLPLTALALALTFLYEKTDNLLAPIFAHSAFNAANLLVLFATESANRASG